jgi:hypothetical protein
VRPPPSARPSPRAAHPSSRAGTQGPPTSGTSRVRLLQPPAAELQRRHRLLVARRELLAERLEVEREGGALVRPHWDAHALHEDWVRRADLRADRCCEGEVCGLEVVWTPADNEGVEGDDERGEARRLGAARIESVMSLLRGL